MAKKKLKKKLREFFTRNFVLVLIIIGFSSIFIINLSGQDYSLDETETVTLGRSILKYGIPSAWDGLNLISGSGGLDSVKIGDLYVWRWHPWMQHYLAATGLILFGDYVGATRLPFAVIGILTVVLLFFISQEIFKNKFISFIISLHLIFLLPFFLYVRNVRYYSPATFLSLLVLFLLLRFISDKWGKKSSAVLLLTTFLLFHTNYLIWLSSILIVSLTLMIKKNKTIFYIVVFEVLFGLIWFLFFKPYGGNIGISSSTGLQLLINIAHYISYINNYIFPLILVLILVMIRKTIPIIFLFLMLILGVKLLFYSVFLYAHGRYLIDLFPIFILFYGFIYQYLIKKKYWYICILIFLIVISTNILNLFLQWPLHPTKARLDFWLPKYKIELVGQYRTAMPQLGEYLQKKYHKGDLMWSNVLSYNYTKVPTISPIFSNSKNIYIGPDSITNPEKIRWYIFFKNYLHPDYETDIKNLLGGKKYIRLRTEYKKIDFVYDKGTVLINDVDIYNRQFPPEIIPPGRIVIYEKKESQ